MAATRRLSRSGGRGTRSSSRARDNNGRINNVLIRAILIVFVLLYTSIAQSETFTIAGGQTVRSSNTEHDAYRVEMNFGWKPEFWSNSGWTLSLNHALSIMTFRDENTVNAISWAPNIILFRSNKSGYYPYVQLSLGAAYLSDDQFKSKPKPHPCNCLQGVADMGSHGQFETGLAVGLIKNRFSIRAKIYHYSNANLANKNDGMDVAEFGVSYSL